MPTPPVLSQELLDDQVRRSVVQVDPGAAAGNAPGGARGLLFMVAAYADSMIQWGTAPIARDQQLRQFLPTESMTLSALSTVVARNVTFKWKLKGDEAAIEQAQAMLQSANRGAGWADLVSKTSWDLYGSDRGAFIEMIRTANSPFAPCIGLQHLDAVRCWLTGDPEFPVYYCDLNGVWHKMAWYQVVNLQEMAAPIERPGLGSLQYCALTRILKASQIYRDISTYFGEKVGGRHTRAVHVVSGVNPTEMAAAIASTQVDADQQLLTRYIQPVVLSTLDPKTEASVATLDFAGIPDGFDAEQQFKQFVTIIAMGLLSDYQDFSPLPGGGLGSGAQSETLANKTKGKGPGLWQALMLYALNFRGALPQNVQFEFDEQDVQSDIEEATAAKSRAERRQIDITSGVLDAQAARQLAVDDGDLDPEVAKEIDARDEERKAEEAKRLADLATQATAAMPAAGGTTRPASPGGEPAGNSGGPTRMATAVRAVSPQRVALESEAAVTLAKLLAGLQADLDAALEDDSSD